MKMIRTVLLAAAICCTAAPIMMHAQAKTQAPAEAYNQLMSGMEKEIVSAAEAMPADKFNFSPTQGEFKGVRTYAGQVKHLTEANYGFFMGWGVSGAVKRDDIEKLTSKDDIVKALRDSYVYAHKAIDTITSQNAFEVVDTGEGKMTRAALATFCLAHSMDHYGQMVVYLRMNGIVPPASRKNGM